VTFVSGAGSNTAVVITCFELGRTLPDAVDSALGQSSPPQEVVVVDDGSRDPFTRQVIAKLHTNGVRVIASEHRGPAHARNLGVNATTAALVVLLDGDDLFEPTYLERAGQLLADRADLSFVCCALQAFGRASYRWMPPPYAVASAVARGACGHISTVFRREVWEAVGGFDESLPAYEDVDFWLRALELGFRGEIVDEALVRYRVRVGSRYHSTVVAHRYLPAKELLARKHADAVLANGEDLFATLLDFQRELTGHARSLEAERLQLEREITELERDLSASADALGELGADRFDWGMIGAGRRATGGTDAPILGHYLDLCLAEAAEDGRTPRKLTVAPGDPWPDEEAAFDLIVVARALEHADDPATALALCRGALRPGGMLLVAAGTSALRAERGFTEAALRFLLCRLFPAEDVEVWTFGNHLTSLATAAGLPVEELNELELSAVDPSHPTLVAGRACAPRRRGKRKRQEHRPRVAGRASRLTTRGAILAYHRVGSLDRDFDGLRTDPELFRAHMELLASRADPMPLEELVARARAGELPPGAVSVTFDDGSLDHLEVASPVLSELGIPATFFVASGRLDEQHEPWWDTVERVLITDAAVPPRLRLGSGDTSLDLPTGSLDERRNAVGAIHALVLGVELPSRDAVIAQLIEWSGRELPVRNTHRLMTSQEVLELSGEPGHEIGAHGAHHLALTEHPEDVRRRELALCKAQLEHLLERPIESLAYPFGMTDLLTTEIAASLGFSLGCTVDPDPVTRDCDPLRTPRLEIGNADPHELGFRLEHSLSSGLAL
jgi:peptidoglycan/xylan/chitin deacetylase (PgdA/CDA1 family)/GT2 family glycosyltransferase/SAM-dependent methyltransferase